MRPRRKFPRYVAEILAEIREPVTGMRHHVTMTSLSLHGCAIEGSEPIHTGNKYELTAEWQGRNLRVEGEIVWKDPKRSRAGMKFLSVDQKTQEVLREICSNLRLQPLTQSPVELD